MHKITQTTALIFIILIYSCVYQYSIASSAQQHKPLKTVLPGTEKYNPALLDEFEKKQKLRGKPYKARTRHITSNGEPLYTNRLFLESSPYLLQHAHNPVNWYPWGEEAFITAAKLNRPVLLSIGYSTCHWCHVMESESFEDIEIAQYINENYIAIKVDREERPDIDATYMTALQVMGQGGGWPLNVWLTSEKKPFFGGTYYPARDGDRGATIGLLTLLKKLNATYQSQPDKIHRVSQNLVKEISSELSIDHGKTLPTTEVFKLAMNYYSANFDTFYGGIGDAPKFPGTTPIQFLLRYYIKTNDKKALQIAELTLDKMASGGIYDQVGGGFHRYSIDNEWLVPHFEKMLYDNALLTIDYLEAYQITKNPVYKEIVNETLRYISRDMTSPEGGFYSATDADSITEDGSSDEGHYFTWDSKEFSEVLGNDLNDIMKKYYSVTVQGNFEGRNILNTPVNKNTYVKTINISIPQFEKNIIQSKNLLFLHREKRNKPLRDEKIITAWNGLMISAYAKAGFILNNKDYIIQAGKAADFILNNLFINGRLLRNFNDKSVGFHGYLDDYAFFIAGLIDLYESTNNIKWLNQAIELDIILQKQFEDKKNGGYYLTGNDHEKLISRIKPDYDGALPSGNSIQVLNLLRLGLFTSKNQYNKRAINALSAFSKSLTNTPMNLSKMLLSVDYYYSEAKEIIIITPEGKKNSNHEFIEALRGIFLPNRILSVITEGNDLKNQIKTVPIAQGKKAINGKTTAYVCKSGTCELPTNNIKTFIKQINNK